MKKIDPSGEPKNGLAVPQSLNMAAQYAWRLLIIAVALYVTIRLLAMLYLVTVPIIVAILIATVLSPAVNLLERKGLRRIIGTSLIYTLSFGFISALVYFFTPEFVKQAQQLRPTLEEGVERTLDWLEEGPVGWDREQVSSAVAGFFTGENNGRISQAVISLGEIIAGAVLAIVLSFFFVKDGRLIMRWVYSRVPHNKRLLSESVGRRVWRSLGGFIRGTSVVAAVDAIFIGLGLWIIGVPLVIPLAVLVFFGGFIPVVGAAVTGLLAVLVALAWGGVGPAVATLLVVLIVQQVESNVLQPVIMKRSVNLHPVVILAALTAGASVAGIIGAFLAVPVAAAVTAAANEIRLHNEASSPAAGASDHTAL